MGVGKNLYLPRVTTSIYFIGRFFEKALFVVILFLFFEFPLVTFAGSHHNTHGMQGFNILTDDLNGRRYRNG